MENKVKEFIIREKLIDENDTIVVGLSGGVDSMVLFTVLRLLGYKLVVAHVNHNVRKESDEELLFTKAYVTSFNIPYESIKLGKIENTNFQDEARRLRYQFFQDVAKKYNATKIATAHHLDDLIETVLMRISRGSNLYGYGGIKPFVEYNDHIIIRPLLCVTKEEIKQYQKDLDIPFREDASNQKDTYTRNRFRHAIVPVLTKENPNVYTNIYRYSKQMYQAFEHIRKETIDLYQKNNGILINKTFVNLDEALQYDYLSYTLEQNNIESSFNKLALMRNLILSDKPNGNVSLSDDYTLKKNYETAVICKNNNKEDYEFKINENEEILLPNGDIVKIRRNLENSKAIYLKLCYNNIRFPLIIRNRRDGDIFHFKFGNKKIKKLFIDMKIPMETRQTVPFVLNEEGEILGIPGIIKGPADVQNPIYIIYERKLQND